MNTVSHLPYMKLLFLPIPAILDNTQLPNFGQSEGCQVVAYYVNFYFSAYWLEEHLLIFLSAFQSWVEDFLKTRYPELPATQASDFSRRQECFSSERRGAMDTWLCSPSYRNALD